MLCLVLIGRLDWQRNVETLYTIKELRQDVYTIEEPLIWYLDLVPLVSITDHFDQSDDHLEGSH